MFKLITKSDGSGVSSNGNGGNGGNSSNGRGGDGQSKSTDGKMPNFRKSTAAVRAPLAVITSSSGLSFVFLVALMQNAGLSVVVPSLALQLEALGSDLALLGLVAAAAPFVSVVSPTLFGYLADWCARGRVTDTPFTLVYLVSLVAFIMMPFVKPCTS